MTKKGLKGPKQLNGYKKMIHNEMFKVDYETLLQQHIENKYIEYFFIYIFKYFIYLYFILI